MASSQLALDTAQAVYPGCARASFKLLLDIHAIKLAYIANSLVDLNQQRHRTIEMLITQA